MLWCFLVAAAAPGASNLRLVEWIESALYIFKNRFHASCSSYFLLVFYIYIINLQLYAYGVIWCMCVCKR